MEVDGLANQFGFSACSQLPVPEIDRWPMRYRAWRRLARATQLRAGNAAKKPHDLIPDSILGLDLRRRKLLSDSDDLRCRSAAGPCAATLRLRRNTVLGNACVYVPILALAERAEADASSSSFSVEASQNVFYPTLGWPVFLANYDGQSPPQAADLAALLPSLTNWRGERNLFPTERRLLEVSVRFDRKQAESVADLAAWSGYWGPTDSDSLQGRVQLQGGAILNGLYASPEKIQAEDFRLRPDSPGHRAGPDGKDLGADVDLVGPGAAYDAGRRRRSISSGSRTPGESRSVRRRQNPRPARSSVSAARALRNESSTR